jgi:hypothetical protein
MTRTIKSNFGLNRGLEAGLLRVSWLNTLLKYLES